MTNLECRTMRTYKNLHKKGPFGLFLQRVEASRDPEIIRIVKSYQDERFMNEAFFRQVAGRKKKATIRGRLLSVQVGGNHRFSDDKIYEKLEDSDKGPVENDGESPAKDGDHGLEDPTLCQRNTLLNYYLFRRLSSQTKKQYSKVFRKRYDVPLTNGFCKQYLAVNKPEKFRKTSFLLWLNAYLRNKVSTEMLRLSSFEIALKAGNVWNTLPNEEKRKWYKLLNQDMYRKKF